MITSPDVLLLDEPTASLDADNRAIVVELIHAARAQGSAIVGIFHDDEVREAVATRTFDVEQHRNPL
jgi:alpha-D-ribose 1-methylphosphonate 5-triphosphate synthase subunit PhnL